jgi:hypothetical protein
MWVRHAQYIITNYAILTHNARSTRLNHGNLPGKQAEKPEQWQEHGWRGHDRTTIACKTPKGKEELLALTMIDPA